MPFFQEETRHPSADTDCGEAAPEARSPAPVPATIRDLDPETAKALVDGALSLPDPRNSRGFLRDSLLKGLVFGAIDRKQERADLYDRFYEENLRGRDP